MSGECATSRVPQAKAKPRTAGTSAHARVWMLSGLQEGLRGERGRRGRGREEQFQKTIPVWRALQGGGWKCLEMRTTRDVSSYLTLLDQSLLSSISILSSFLSKSLRWAIEISVLSEWTSATPGMSWACGELESAGVGSGIGY